MVTTIRTAVSVLVITFLLASCASYVPYPLDHPLSAEPFLSRGNTFTGRAPQGWFFASEDTLAQDLAAWVVREDFAAALAVQEMHLDQLSETRVRKEGLRLLGTISSAFHASGKKNVEVDIPPREFSIGKRKYCGFELREGAARKRVVVFTAGGRYYECVATPLKGAWTAEQTRKLFTAQQAFLGSLTF